MYMSSRFGVGLFVTSVVALCSALPGCGVAEDATTASDAIGTAPIPAIATHPYECGTHADCRAGFLSAYEAAAAVTPGAVHSVSSIMSGGDALPIDLAFFPAPVNRDHRVMVLSSGVHGLEGFTGSALQQLFLHEQLERTLAAGIDVLVIHGINVWGMQNYRRHTEARVDLNRNWFLPDEFPHDITDGEYDSFRGVFEHDERAHFSNLDFTHFVAANLVPNLRSARSGALTKAAAQGQYSHPEGISFGGNGYEPHRAVVVDALNRYVTGHANVMALDLHTGLGRRQLQLLPNPAPSEVALRDQKAVFEVAGRTIEATGGATFYSSHGDFSDFVCDYARAKLGATMCTNMLAEIGTVMPAAWDDDRWFGGITDLKKSAYLLYLTVRENQLYHHGATSLAAIHGIRDEWTHMFRPTDNTWYEMVVSEGRTMFPAWIDRFATYSPTP